MLKTLIIPRPRDDQRGPRLVDEDAVGLVDDRVDEAAQQQPPQPRRPGEWCPVGWSASGNYCVPASDKAPQAVPKKGWCPAGWRESGSYCIR